MLGDQLSDLAVVRFTLRPGTGQCSSSRLAASRRLFDRAYAHELSFLPVKTLLGMEACRYDSLL